jgi:hypothetical protein
MLLRLNLSQGMEYDVCVQTGVNMKELKEIINYF